MRQWTNTFFGVPNGVVVTRKTGDLRLPSCDTNRAAPSSIDWLHVSSLKIDIRLILMFVFGFGGSGGFVFLQFEPAKKPLEFPSPGATWLAEL